VATADKRKALGRGLGALIPGAVSLPSSTVRRDYFVCAIEEIHPSRDNPRQGFDEPSLGELAESIRSQGLIQPLVVRSRPASEGGGFTLIAGERRWRAAQRAGLKDVPVVVKEASPAQAFELALVENLQRRDLNAIEEAEAYRRLTDEHGYSPEQLAQRVGKDRATIANTLRLLALPPPVRQMVAAGQLQMGHARALLGLGAAQAIEQAAERVVKDELSVRQTEALVQRERAPKKSQPEERPRSPSVRDLEQRIERTLGVRARVVERGPGAGRLELDYRTLDELDRVLDRLLKP
jgi:ParB family chromosome partitioning protein